MTKTNIRKAIPKIIIAGFLLMPLLISAQEKQPWEIGARGSYGFLWPHRQDLWILVEKHAIGVELFAEKQVNGDKPWHQYYKGPSYGVGLLYVNFENPEKIGTVVRVLPYLYLPFTNNGKSSFGIRLGWGVGYVAKPYDRRENTQQIAIGSKINMAVLLMAEYHRSFGRNTIMAGVGIDHWSNGSYRQPNLGINYLALNIGISRALGNVDPYVQRPDTTRFKSPKRTYSVVFGFGVNEVERAYTGQYTAYSIVGQVQWRVSRKSTLGAGVDIFNKGSLAFYDESLEDRPRIELTQVGLHGEYALVLGNNEIYFDMGVYLYTPVPEDSKVFHRVGYRYKAGDHLVLNFSLKSHFAVADHVEIGLGYKWN